jgi:glutamate-1-semialdehyde 2,1-aminomutase
MAMARRNFRRSKALFMRALQVVPGGIYGHQNPALLTRDEFPYFLAEGEGCRVRDVDGNEYIDYLCAYGPIVLGYRHPKVEAAADKQRARIDTSNLPAANFVQLAEQLVELTPGADWAMFAKNGSDVCSWALAIARAATGRDLVAMVEHTYHGVHGWCNHGETGFPDADRASNRYFQWNDLASLERVFDEHAGRIAGVIITPFRHEAFCDSVLPAPGFLNGVRDLCDRHGAVMIVDDVRAGFRLHHGGSTQRWGVTPDLLLYSKALANGYPLSAVLGRDALREAAKNVFVTGTFFTQAVPIAAAMATLDEIQASGAIGHMARMGQRLCNGLAALARTEGFEVMISGPSSIPFMTFVDDAGSFERAFAFAGACAQRGVFFHPIHNWFISAALTEADVDQTLEIAGEAFREVQQRFAQARKVK